MAKLDLLGQTKVYEHIRTGKLYYYICTAMVESDPDVKVIVYKSKLTGECWTRPEEEFKQKFKLFSVG